MTVYYTREIDRLDQTDGLRVEVTDQENTALIEKKDATSSIANNADNKQQAQAKIKFKIITAGT